MKPPTYFQIVDHFENLYILLQKSHLQNLCCGLRCGSHHNLCWYHQDDLRGLLYCQQAILLMRVITISQHLDLHWHWHFCLCFLQHLAICTFSLTWSHSQTIVGSPDLVPCEHTFYFFLCSSETLMLLFLILTPPLHLYFSSRLIYTSSQTQL